MTCHRTSRSIASQAFGFHMYASVSNFFTVTLSLDRQLRIYFIKKKKRRQAWKTYGYNRSVYSSSIIEVHLLNLKQARPLRFTSKLSYGSISCCPSAIPLDWSLIQLTSKIALLVILVLGTRIQEGRECRISNLRELNRTVTPSHSNSLFLLIMIELECR